MAGRKLNAQQRAAMFSMRNRRGTGVRDFPRLHISASEAELADLVSDGYLTVTTQGGHTVWVLTAKGRNWVDRNL